MPTLTQGKIHDSQKPTILVVEDDEDNLIYVFCSLDLFGYRCITAQDAQQGFSLAQQHQPDLILLDIKLPHVSGIDLMEMLKLHLLTQNIPVIAVTALAKEQEKQLILNAGFSDYLVKPYLIEDLERIVCSNILNTALCQFSSVPNLSLDLERRT